MDNDIVELQSKLVFQEDVLQKLDDAVVRQNTVIDQLVQRIESLEDKLETMTLKLEAADSTAGEQPPHY